MQVVARALIVVGLTALAVPARAEPLSKPAQTEARSHLALGNKLYGVRSFEEAVTEYKAGALVEPAPVFDYNLGQCYRQLGKYQEAIWHYDRFLVRGKPQGELLDAVNGFITQMKSELDKKAMTQKPTEPGPSPASAMPPPRDLQSSPAHALQTQTASQSADAWYEDGVGWGLAAAGAIGLAAGGGLIANALSLNNDANASTSQETYNRLHDKADTRMLLGVVTGVGGAGLLVTGIIKLVIHTERPLRGAGWRIDASSRGVTVFARF